MANSAEVKLSEEDLQRFYDLNNEKQEIEKELKQLKKQIHHYFDQTFGSGEKAEVKLGKYKAQRSIRASVKYDDEKTVEKLEELNLKEFIVEVKQPDTDKLESAMKLDFVDEQDFAECKKERISQAITVKELSI
ncbi:flagellin-like hook-associated protein FlgL [Alkalibacillus filiformis]|uniref:Flagellin-like hook-associated protein FlgL n=1 Tax=Alkalibacillus filiformis TaxID=200990 RepID=A0ABU0DPL5_9BACI|nr:hypothetical protein [Alkalibacillus filiformis]MDQ0350385.1 flagellin-like hook-associated protein FlgL [Alkalibacillus filiformis]